jgi:hypothetical protein
MGQEVVLGAFGHFPELIVERGIAIAETQSLQILTRGVK